MSALSISYDIVALLEYTNFVNITMWNWKSGRQILVRHPQASRDDRPSLIASSGETVGLCRSSSQESHGSPTASSP